MEVRQLEPTRLAGIRRVGPYGPEIGETFRKLEEWLSGDGREAAGGRYSCVYYDDPSWKAAEKLRCDCCVEVPEGFEIVDAANIGVAEVCLAAREVGVVIHKGSYSGLEATYKQIFSSMLPRSGRFPSGDPIYDVYLNKPGDVPEEELLTEIHVPLSAVRCVIL